MRRFGGLFAVLVFALLLWVPAHAGRGHVFWECFGQLVEGGVPCLKACAQCVAESGSKVDCGAVCGSFRTVPWGSRTGVVIRR